MKQRHRLFAVGRSNYCSVLVLLFLYLPSNATLSQSLPDLLETINPDVVTVVTYDSLSEPVGQGTGFFLSTNRVITCWHVVDNAYAIYINTEDDVVTVIDSVGAIDWEGDLVELFVQSTGRDVRGLILSSDLPRQGESIFVVGNPLGLERSISDGIVASVRTISDFGEIIQITAPISEGSSGSPVINELGEVIGVASFTMIDGQNINFAIPTERIVNIQENYEKQIDLIVENMLSQDNSIEHKIEEAKQLMEDGSYANASKTWEAVLADTAKYFYGTFKYGMCLLYTHNYRSAITQFNKANEIVETSAAYYNKYLSFLILGDSTNAMTEIKKAMELDPTDSSNQIATAELHYGLGHYTQAISILGTYLDRYSSDTYGLSLYCYSLYYTEQFDVASECFDIYLSEVPGDVDAMETLALLLNDDGRYEEALNIWKKCSKQKRSRYLHFWGMAESHLGLGDSTEALKSFSIAIALDSSVAELHNDYGILLKESRNYNEAKIQFQEANRLSPIEWRYLWNLGNMYLYLNQDEKGSEALRKAKLLKKATN